MLPWKKYGKQYDEYKIHDLSIGEFMTTDFAFLKGVVDQLFREIQDDRLVFTIKNLKAFIDKSIELNLGHLCFHRAIPTLSGGRVTTITNGSSIYNSALRFDHCS